MGSSLHTPQPFELHGFYRGSRIAILLGQEDVPMMTALVVMMLNVAEPTAEGITLDVDAKVLRLSSRLQVLDKLEANMWRGPHSIIWGTFSMVMGAGFGTLSGLTLYETYRYKPSGSSKLISDIFGSIGAGLGTLAVLNIIIGVCLYVGDWRASNRLQEEKLALREERARIESELRALREE